VLAKNVCVLLGPVAVKVRLVGETLTPLRSSSKGIVTAAPDDGRFGSVLCDLHDAKPSKIETIAAVKMIRLPS